MILDDILARTRVTVAEARQALPLAELEVRARAAPPPRDFWGRSGRRPGADGDHCRVQAPIAVGGLDPPDATPEDIVPRYQQAGAACLSVLTDQPFFGGQLEDLAGRVRRAPCPSCERIS
jgi:indole-3-glycerol phosphate synthase